jgi:hypothetical protein
MSKKNEYIAQMALRRASRTPDDIAAELIRFAGRGINADIVAATYESNAADSLEVAAKAAAHKTGKHRGYTQDHALELAALNRRNAVEVPAAIRRLLAQ